MHTKALVIAAAGSGTRMEKEVPKPYLRLGESTILEQTIRAFLPLSGLRQVVLTVSEGRMPVARRLLSEVLPQHIAGRAVVGGSRRQESIWQALQEVEEAGLVLVHDAVRPFIKLAHIKACCAAAAEVGGAVLGIPATDTIKQVKQTTDQQLVQKTLDRRLLWQTQTPQIFQKEVLFKAYEHARSEDYVGTDDASLVEHMGYPVKMIKGSRENIKITYPLDLEIAKIILKKRAG